MTVLSFDTSTDILSICLITGSDIHQYDARRPLRHAEALLPGISGILSESSLKPEDLDLLVCSRGPGSFTGLRIGMTTAKGLSEGTGVPVVSVDTLDALAWGLSFFDGAVLPVIDARKGRFYGAVFSGGIRQTKQLDASAVDLLHLVKPYDRVLLTGPGSSLVSKTWENERTGVYCMSIPLYYTGYSLAVLGMERFEKEGIDNPEQGPEYIRRSDAELNGTA